MSSSSKYRFWSNFNTWEEAENAWEERAKKYSNQTPLKGLKKLPSMPGISPSTKKNIRWKAFKYMVKHDEGGKVRKQVKKHPFKYAFNYLKSISKPIAYQKDRDFYFYGLQSEEEFLALLEQNDTLFVMGFSYCHKPFECPSGRFSDQCQHEDKHPVCSQCFIGKCIHSVPDGRAIPLSIPTVHYIGNQILSLAHAHPNKKIVFLITACEMTLHMFADWGNMMDIKGIGVRLDGRICNTMKAFDLSEKGIKPGLTVVTTPTQKRIVSLLKRLTIGEDANV